MEQKFERGQLILARFKTKGDVRYLWNAQQYMAEDEKRLFFLGGFLEKEGYEILPFEGNEHLLGTRNDPAPKWEPKPDELVAVRDNKQTNWFARKFIKKNGRFFRCFPDTGESASDWRFCEPLRDHFNVPD